MCVGAIAGGEAGIRGWLALASHKFWTLGRGKENEDERQYILFESPQRLMSGRIFTW